MPASASHTDSCVPPDFQNTPIDESDRTSAISILQTARKSTAKPIQFNSRGKPID
jgi:hypothetical protein